ncbi:MAG TPA: FAD-dependent oxidoreductase [Pseudonocardiaceae bacterium]|nr:FAD-dependent oxidoreductase [Pseudonocardiaceae bacterium]
MSRRRERIVVAGAGVAGLRAAERLRELGFAGELVIIGAEPHRPYHRPAVSKQLVTDEWKPADAILPAYRALDAHWRLGTTALRLDPSRRLLALPGEEKLRYDGLVIATGIAAKHLPGAPGHHPRIQRLRTLRDALTLRAGLAGDKGPVVVVGTGFTGCEVACAMRALRRTVTIVGRSSMLLATSLGPELGARLTRLHHDNGVRLELGVGIAHWGIKADAAAIYLSNGKILLASHVVLAVGSTPGVGWLRGSGLVVDNGVLCEPTCHAVGARDIVAAGDVARWPNLRFDRTPRRIEHWINAVEMGRAAAESLLAGRSAAKPFTPVPRFWTEQHGVRVQAVGLPELNERSHPRHPAAGAPAITRYARDGRLVGVAALDQPGAIVDMTRRFDQQRLDDRLQRTVKEQRWHTIAGASTSDSVSSRS